MTYSDFIARKSRFVAPSGFVVDEASLSPKLFPFQRDLVRWALRRGRAALFCQTGLGKTAMQLEWARHVCEIAGGKVLILAPLAVAAQTVREGAKFGVDVRHARRAEDVGPAVTVSNYDILDRFDASQFAGIVLDESSILKSHDSKTRAALIEAFGPTPYKLCATATPAPNDFTELGNHAEFLGAMSRVEMLATFFVHDGGSTQDWRLKGHAEDLFWEWICSWGAVVSRPSDLGYEDGGHALPPLVEEAHILPASHEDALLSGRLFLDEARTLVERRAARAGSMPKRVARAAEIVLAEPDEPWLVWCDLNAESEALKKALPGSVEVKGSDSPEHKEDAMIGFAEGRHRVLVTKPSIAGFGMNWQHCARMIFVGMSDSFEQQFQAIRRCWRFGQTRPVVVHTVTSELEGAVRGNIARKARDAEQMAGAASIVVGRVVRENVRALERMSLPYNATATVAIPSWLKVSLPNERHHRQCH